VELSLVGKDIALAFGCLAGDSRFALRFARKAAVRAANTAVRKMRGGTHTAPEEHGGNASQLK
jgi:hypothetical protein